MDMGDVMVWGRRDMGVQQHGDRGHGDAIAWGWGHEDVVAQGRAHGGTGLGDMRMWWHGGWGTWGNGGTALGDMMARGWWYMGTWWHGPEGRYRVGVMGHGDMVAWGQGTSDEVAQGWRMCWCGGGRTWGHSGLGTGDLGMWWHGDTGDMMAWG